MTGDEIERMYRLLAIAKYDERYVIPKAHIEQAHNLEEMGCSLDFEEGPGMFESGPFGEASGRPVPVALELVRAVAKLPRLRVRGLMSIPDHAPDFETQLALHQGAKRLFDQIAALGEPGLEHFDTLSMGMTADLEAAIQAGSTLVRVGTGIFGGRTYPAA